MLAKALPGPYTLCQPPSLVVLLAKFVQILPDFSSCLLSQDLFHFKIENTGKFQGQVTSRTQYLSLRAVVTESWLRLRVV